MPRLSIRARSLITAPGRSSSETIRSRIAWYARSEREVGLSSTRSALDTTDTLLISSEPSADERKERGRLDSLVPRDRAVRGAAADQRDRRRRRPGARRGRSLWALQGQGRP